MTRLNAVGKQLFAVGQKAHVAVADAVVGERPGGARADWDQAEDVAFDGLGDHPLIVRRYGLGLAFTDAYGG